MKEIVVISGKGGTGKTSITASFAVLGGGNLIAADCDVDAADMHLLLEPDLAEQEDFYSGETAFIDSAVCNSCGECARVCRYDAIDVLDGEFRVNPVNCEGCGYCARICPEDAITNLPQKAGVRYISRTRPGFTMVHARLGIGAENSGKLVAHVKNEAKTLAEAGGKRYVLVDGSPGIGCPVVSSLSGADFVVLVTEPTVSGIHDLERVYKLVKRFNIPAGCIINKADINAEMTGKIAGYLESEGIVLLAQLPYDESFTRAMVAQRTIVEYGDSRLKDLLIETWHRVCGLADKNTKETTV